MQISFRFKNDEIDKNVFKVLEPIKNLNFLMLDTRTGIVNRNLTIFFDAKDEMIKNVKFGRYENLKEEFSEFVECIEIEESAWLGSSAKMEKKDLLYTIDIEDLEDILNLYFKTMDYIRLEQLLYNSILGSGDGFITKENLDALNIENRFMVLTELVKKDGKIHNKHIRRIFILIDDKDFLLKKLVCSYILRKDNYTKIADLEKAYRKAKGTDLFNKREKELIGNGFNDNHVQKLEMFFRHYTTDFDFKENIKFQKRLHPEKVRIEIPLNPNAYDFEKQFPEDVCVELRYAFRNKIHLVLECFRRVVIVEMLRRDNMDIEDSLLVCFKFDNSSESLEELRKDGLFFDNLNDLLEEKSDVVLKYDKSLDNIVENRNSFLIFHGFSQESKRKERKEITWKRTFQIRDHTRNHVFNCIINRNKAHFSNLILNMESEIIIQAYFHIDFQFMKNSAKWIIKEKYFEIVDILVLDNFKAISIEIGKHFNGVSKLENTRDGLLLYKYPKNEKVYYTKIMDVPLILLNLYKGQNSIFYECLIGKDKICKAKNDLVAYIENETTFSFISGAKFKDYISLVLNAYKKKTDMVLKQMYNTIGLFMDEKNEIVISHPENKDIAVIGENDIQVDAIENLKNLGLDKKGNLCKNFYNILHIKTQKVNFRLGVFGYSAIHPFLYFLKKYLDVFPNLFVIGIAGSGKTTLLEILLNDLYGTKMKSPDTIDSVARLTKYSTESTFALNIDDIDILDEKLMNWIKTNSTRKGTRDRLTKDNKKISEQTYSSYAGSANSKDFISGVKNDAFRKRCLIFELMHKIDLHEETTKFEEQKAIIKDNKVFGIYFLEKSIEYIQSLYSDKDLNFHQKLVKLIKEKKDEFKKYLTTNEIRICDIRRLTIYALIYVGWELWNQVFKTKKLESPILKDALNLDTGIFERFVQELEDAEHNISLEIIDNILEFYIGHLGNYGLNKTPDEKVVLQRNFINAYDEFAKRRGYDTLGSLTKLGDIQSEILNKPIKPGTIYFYHDKKSANVSEYGIVWYFDEIDAIRNNRNPDEPKPENKEESGKIDLDRLFKTDGMEKFQKLLDRMKAIFSLSINKEIELRSIVQALELEENNSDVVNKFIQICLMDGIIDISGGFITLKDK